MVARKAFACGSKKLRTCKVYWLIFLMAILCEKIFCQRIVANHETNDSSFKPNLYLISIGISDYKNYPEAHLRYAAKDAIDIDSAFKTSKYYGQVHSFLLPNQLAYRDTILRLKKELFKTGVDDYVVLFFSGHGYLNSNMDFFACTYNIDTSNLKNTAVSFDEMEDLLDSIPSRKKFFFIDACFSGETDKTEIKRKIIDASKTAGIGTSLSKTFGPESKMKIYGDGVFELMQETFVDIRRKTGTNIISSSKGLEVSYEQKPGEGVNGVFTYALMNAFRNNTADLNKDGEILISEFFNYVVNTVKLLSNSLQMPTIREENPDFDYRIW